jgi:hypothetical protein
MNLIVSSLMHLYGKLLLLYPSRFHEEFADEMQVVFRDSLDEAIKRGWSALALVCIKELIGLPFNVLQEFWHESQRKEMFMLPENTFDPFERPTTNGQILMGAFPFFLFGLILIYFKLPMEWVKSGWSATLGITVFELLLVLPAVGFGVGWVQNFPRWSYPYAGMALILAFYIQNASTPGLSFFGIPIFGRELWGWRAWIPLTLASINAIVISRSLKPITRFFSNLWKDWSVPSYFMSGTLPLIVMIAFDEIDQIYSLYFMPIFAVLLVGMVTFYLRSQTTGKRVLILTLGALVIIFSAALTSNFYWQEHNGISPTGARSRLLSAGIISLIVLLPAWLELIRRWLGRNRLA